MLLGGAAAEMGRYAGTGRRPEGRRRKGERRGRLILPVKGVAAAFTA